MVQHSSYPPTLGARYQDDGTCRFLVWAPKVNRLDLRLFGNDERLLPMQPRERGYFELVVEGVAPGTRYFYRIDGERDRPDPASRFQPDGVHLASAVVDPNFDWTDNRWNGILLHEYITYELHVGTFTRPGTFDAAIAHLDELKELGITAIELMPVAQFPGARNWGYDGVHPFAVQNTYGGPDGLKRLIDAAHARELAVVMDVVYNHLGPEGNYFAEFGHYFTDRHRTPWGRAINFDDRESDEVRRFFIENALYWIDEYHVDALRLDAVHAIYSLTAYPFLQELSDAVRLAGEVANRRVYTIAESSSNDPRLVASKVRGGTGIDAQWSNDLHHSLHTLLTDERTGYYADYDGFADVAKAYREGFVLDGRYAQYRGRRHGVSGRDIDPKRLVVYSQNHDQVGNRMLGERLTEMLSFEDLKLAAAVVMLSPFQPLLFMGEEYGETAPFHYFISHHDPDLIEAVRHGRQKEFAHFRWSEPPPDPHDEATFERCQLNHDLKHTGQHRVLLEYYKSLIHLRKTEPALSCPSRQRMEITTFEPGQAMAIRSWSDDRQVLTLFHFGTDAATLRLPVPTGVWHKRIDSSEPQWQGPGSLLPVRVESSGEVTLPLPPRSVAVYGTVEG